jgi:hypothetical protein
VIVGAIKSRCSIGARLPLGGNRPGWLMHRNCCFDSAARVGPVKKAYWIDGRRFTDNDLRQLRESLKKSESVTAISNEMRDVIETEWPDLAAKLLPPKR